MDESPCGFRRLVMLLNAGYVPVLPCNAEGVLMEKRLGFMRHTKVICYDNGTVVFLPRGGEVRIRSFDPDDAMYLAMKSVKS